MLPSVPDGVEHAYIVTGQVEQALEDCGRRGVAVASIFSGGFADAGAEGLKRQQRLVERARELGVRLLGPNSMGVINVAGRMALSVNAVLDMEKLEVETFVTEKTGGQRGTVQAHVTEVGGQSCYQQCSGWNFTDWNSCVGGCSDSGCGQQWCQTE